MLWYLASPISDPNPAVVKDRLDTVIALQYTLLDAGIMCYCPHAHWNQAVERYNPPSGWEYWEAPSFAFLDKCDGLIIYCLPGHARSVGVKGEFVRAVMQDKPIYHIRPQLEVFVIEEIKQKHYGKN